MFSNEGIKHITTHVQVAKDAFFGEIVMEKYINYENWYENKNKNKGVSLEKSLVKIPSDHKSELLYFRLRYRNLNLIWSPWSDTISNIEAQGLTIESN